MSTLVSDLEANGYQEVLELGEWDYSWQIAKVFRDERSNRIFILTDGGCSCTSWGDGFDSVLSAVEQMVEIPNLEAAKRELDKWSDYYEKPNWLDVKDKLYELGLR